MNECTSALEASPGYAKALVWRAKAYENMGHYKQVHASNFVTFYTFFFLYFMDSLNLYLQKEAIIYHPI